MGDDSVCDLEFIIAQLVGDITEEQVSLLSKIQDKNRDEEEEN
jgi:hypothetical protein